MRRLSVLTLALSAVAGAQTQLVPLWTRPSFDTIYDVDTDSNYTHTLALSQQQLSVFPVGSSVPLWHMRTLAGDANAKFSQDGSIVVLTGHNNRL
ncbi:hypothetical protein BH11ARM2_BH11ARM2_18470 [soil metagenome]